jgi:superfamily II DNA or RNA helicase
MSDINVENLDPVNIKIHCDESISKELNTFFTFQVPNFKYTPAYRNKKWDGQIRLFNSYTKKIYAGLLKYIVKFAEDKEYSVEYELETDDDVCISETKSFVDSLEIESRGEKITPHDYQIDAINHSIKNERCLLLSPTGSGKSLIIYSLVRYYEEKLKDGEQILIIVPTTSLVSQMYNDFRDYAGSKWDVDSNCHVIFSGQDKVSPKKVVISTWQSIYKLPVDYFNSYKVVIGDEAHQYKSKSLTGIMTKMLNTDIRIATTGTLDNVNVHKLVIEGLFGPVYKVTSTKELMSRDLLSNLQIDCIVLQYDETDIAQIKRAPYIDEIKWLVQQEKRNKFIANLTDSISGNTLLLFNFVDLHGKPLYELIQQVCSNKRVFFIHGGTDVEQREEIRKIVDNETDAILVASYGTCSTGINIRNINNIVFTSPSKSVVRVLQSIGRGLRRSERKDSVKLYDIGDNLSYKSHKNYSLRHMDARTKIYTNEKFEFKIIPITL